MKRVLVLGGSGFVGRAVCKLLAAQQVRITVPTRQSLKDLTQPGSDQVLPQVHRVQTNVLDAQALSTVVQGHDVVINLVAILHGRPAEFEKIHVQLPETLARVCAQAGVQHLVQVSALGADSQGPSLYQRSKGRGEEVLFDSADKTGLAITVIRPSVIFGKEDQFLNTFARIQRFAPFVPLAGAHTRFQPVWVQDVAQALLKIAQSGPGQHRIYELAGPQVFTLAELVRHAGRWAKRERPVIPLPMWAGKLQAMMMEALPGQPLMSRDNVDSMRVDNVASGALPGLHDLDIMPSPLSRVFQLQ